MSNKDYDFNKPLYEEDAKVVKAFGSLLSFTSFLLAWFAFTYTFNAFIAPLLGVTITPAWALGIVMFLSLVTPTMLDFSNTTTVNKSIIKPIVHIFVSLIVLVASWFILLISGPF